MPISSPASEARSRLAKVERQVGQGRVGELVAHAVQAVGRLEAGRAPRAQGVQQGRAGLVIVAAELGEFLAEVGHRLVEDLDVGQQPERLGRRQRPDDRRRGQPVAGRRRAAFWPSRGRGLAADPGPAAVLVLSGDQRGDQALDPLGQPLRLGRGASRGPSRRYCSAEVAASSSAARSAVVSDGGADPSRRHSSSRRSATPDRRRRPSASSISIRSSVGESTISISGFSYVRPAGRPTKTVVLSLPVPEAEATTCTPQGRIGTSTTSSSFDVADRAGERQPDRVALGDLERLEHDLVDAVALELDASWERPRRARRRRSPAGARACPRRRCGGPAR